MALSFSVLDPRGSQSNVHGFSEDFRSQCFARFVAAFGGTPDVLERQHREHLSFAMSECNRGEAKGVCICLGNSDQAAEREALA